MDQGHGRPEPGRHKKEKKSDDSDVIRKWWWEEGGLLEGGVVPAEPDMIAGVNTETRDVLLKVAQFDSWFAELVESLQVSVVSF